MKFIFQAIVVALCYFAFWRLGLVFSSPPIHGPVVFPASGFSVVALMFYPKLWGGVWLGSFLLHLASVGVLVSIPVPLAAACVAFGSTLQAVVISRVALKLIADYELHANRLFVGSLCCSALCFISAIIGVCSLVYLKMLPIERGGYTIGTWWLGDFSGLMIVGPFLLDWWQIARKKNFKSILSWRATKHDVEAIIGLTVLATICRVIFGGVAPDEWPLFFVVLPILSWLATRQERKWVSAGIVVASGITLSGTFNNNGLFSTGEKEVSLVLLQCYLLVNAVCVLAMSGVSHDRNEAQAHLKLQNEHMAQLVEEQVNENMELKRANLELELRQRELAHSIDCKIGDTIAAVEELRSG